MNLSRKQIESVRVALLTHNAEVDRWRNALCDMALRYSFISSVDSHDSKVWAEISQNTCNGADMDAAIDKAMASNG